jgi:polyisoprenyl-phosphate glycosyltransferase
LLDFKFQYRNLLVLGEIQLLMLGILGEYIGRIFIEVFNRPLYAIAEKIEPIKD